MSDSRTEDFQRYQELCLTTASFKTMEEKEAIAWRLHETSAPEGTLLLGDLLIELGYSKLKPDLKARTYTRETLLPGAFQALVAKPPADQWDWYWLGIAYEMGRGTDTNHELAAKAFEQSRLLGNDLAGFEEAWAAYLANGHPAEGAERFSRVEGPLRKCAAAAAAAFKCLSSPSDPPGSEGYLERIRGLAKLLHADYRHTGGSRRINVTVEAELRKDLEALKEEGTPLGALTLYFVAKGSRRNPTGETEDVWLARSLHRDNGVLLKFLRDGTIPSADIRKLKIKGWGKVELEAWIWSGDRETPQGENSDPDIILGPLSEVPGSTDYQTEPLKLGAFGYACRIQLEATDGPPDQETKERAAWLARATEKFKDEVAAAMTAAYREWIRPEYLQALEHPDRGYRYTAEDLPEVNEPGGIWKIIKDIHSVAVESDDEFYLSFETVFDADHEFVVRFKDSRIHEVMMDG
ncbi:hypothetical protein OKA05_15605 [Luteolibacter arcticus]|uniref:DUF2262 domain-containing protein n=1 Tax=Luteolibacter arcticus TaxID=1581411 RepID=A0ABT3GKE8_9BACT|nr:hypothetical protein [Luteolibacter arcticus]MCW1923993.1 hypothetical protein [Luteolibacter arcticus]